MFNITIDGLAGCGKSTIATRLSQSLDFRCLNSGNIYRAITCHFLFSHATGKIDEDVISEFIPPLDIKVNFDKDVQTVTVNGIDYADKLRDEAVSNLTPVISSFLIVREKVRDIQREFAMVNDCIVEGRDIGRVVLKDADCKLFFVASSEVRAQRRYNQLKEKENCPSYDEILRDIQKRDELDKNREHGAMIPADDAIIIDSSLDTVEQTLTRCLNLINAIKRKGK